MTRLNPAMLAHIQDLAALIRDDLGDDADDKTVLDTIDGETDAGDLLDHMLDEQARDETLVAAIKAHEDRLSHRRKRIEARGPHRKSIMLALVDAMGVKKAERPQATVSKRAGSISVAIEDEASIPSQLKTVKTTTAPDKVAIRKQLEAGVSVPGASLARGDDTISVRWI